LDNGKTAVYLIEDCRATHCSTVHSTYVHGLRTAKELCT